MKDDSKHPEFDRSKYSRPNDRWVCGRLLEGKTCHEGPTPGGKCGATFECSPATTTGEGGVKKSKCGRSIEQGGPCEEGPTKEGLCGRRVAPCSPGRSIRGRRGFFTWFLAGATLATLLLMLGGANKYRFINPGELSTKHANADFGAILGVTNVTDRCDACHVNVKESLTGWVVSGVNASRADLSFGKLFHPSDRDMTSIDQSCVRCHPGHGFHEPNVATDMSCSTCHREHMGAGAMKPVPVQNCATCHGNPEQMHLSSLKGQKQDPALFERKIAASLNLFPVARPKEGFTQVINSFSTDHPEFRVHSLGLKETNSLKFNHQTHLSGNIPKVGGRELSCSYCHEPDASQAFHQKIRFDKHCSACHSIQVDSEHPALQIPHGSVEVVRAFLHSLPTQFEEHARKNLGIQANKEVESFVQKQMARLRSRVPSGEAMERELFFGNFRTAPVVSTGNLPTEGRSRYPGCAYCHEVKADQQDQPVITKPLIPDRWMIHSSFNHSRHTMVACSHCHQVTKSSLTSDILLPTKQNCASCHSPKGGVSESCLKCHQYHNRPGGG